MSRSPAVAMVYLATRDGAVSDTDYQNALDAFMEWYPRFQPSRGIDVYRQEYWNHLE